ncbi:Ribonuclease 3-like protein 2 [Acorus calamus]|uniref:Ribonuclease 3-like protein 2 n=1 Tax=Acorus calamus TaxID=4465 RepID=A0AAV9CT25_ACOCL|nr:Ribonuclease 3-like protein 2 [Acorus calamus]
MGSKRKSKTVEAPPVELAGLEAFLGYNFENKTLLEEARTHKSYTGSVSYERLEFLGDAALGLAISNHLYGNHPEFDQGRLTKLHMTNVSEDKFARVAVKHNLYRFLRRYNCSGMDEKVRDFSDAIGKEGDEQRSETARKVLSDIVESIAAAIYIDCHFNPDLMWECLERLVEVSGTIHEHPVTALKEFCEKNGKVVKYEHSKKGDREVTEVFIDGEPIGYGCSKQRENSKLTAADDALLLRRLWMITMNNDENYE